MIRISDRYDEIIGVKATGRRWLKKDNIIDEVEQLEDALAGILPAAEKYYNIGTWGDEPQFELRAALDAAREALGGE